ncbi:hypothetical protein GCM10008934_16500 [Virgibacillus salarius]|uniref:hypothetical protein n=1 Tax=Virgibacillus salarius TaxID=447199 RepID=UPI0031D04AE1
MNNYKKIGLTKALDIQTIFKSVDEEKSFLLMGTEILYHQPKMSAKAKLILAYILSRPPYW